MPSYQIWNEAIGRCWFQSKNRGRSIVLVTDATFLDSVAYENDIPLGNLTASQHFIDSVRQAGGWQRSELATESRPSTLAYLALAILAVSHMDSEIRQGMTSYWMPFNELYEGNGGSRQIPRALRSIWLDLWLDVKEWANEKNDGEYGFVRFPDHTTYGVRDPHKNIRFPKSQSLLKLEDLKRLTGWFDRLGLQLGESLSRRWVANRIRESLSDASEFSVHARRVFRDNLRFDAAVDQLLSYFAEWDGEVWSPDSERSTSLTRTRMVFAFRSNARLAVGVQKRRGSKWTTESKHHSFPVSRKTISRPLANPLVAVWCDQSRLFIQSKMIAANDRFLIFMKPPSDLAGSDNKAKYFSHFLDDLRKVSSRVEPYTSSSSTRLAKGWEAVSALQQDWCLLSGTANEHLNEPQLTYRTRDIFAPDIVKLRVVGGVKIDRKRWLAGVGPALRVDGPQDSGTIHCSTTADETRVDCSIQFANRRTILMQTGWPLDKLGVHRLWVVGAEGSGLEVRVSNAKLADVDGDVPGWKLENDRWWSVPDVGNSESFVTGALIVGEPLPNDENAISRSRELIDAIVSVETSGRLPKNNLSNNPLVTQIRRAALARN